MANILSMASDRIKKIFKNLKYKYRFVIYNETTFETEYSFLLSKLNILLLFSFLTLMSLIFSFFLITYTPLKDYMPGYGDLGIRRQLREVVNESEKLYDEQQANEKWAENIRKVLKGDLNANKLDIDSVIILDSIK